MHAMRKVLGIVLVLAGIGWISPAAAQEDATVRANVILCSDPDCADTVNIVTMVGATVTSYAPDGSLVDSCTVSLTASEMTVCNIVPAPDRGSYEIWPAEDYVGYRLMSAQPEVFQSEMHGPVYVWYFAPPVDEPVPTAEPPVDVPAPTAVPSASQGVTGLPSTGSGSVMDGAGVLAYAVIPFVIAAAAVVTNRLARD